MLAEVVHADVVVTNPVHVAVALRYAPGQMRGADGRRQGRRSTSRSASRRSPAAAASRSSSAARSRARSSASVAVGGEIPQALYRAVAEILAYIYALRGAAGEAV